MLAKRGAADVMSLRISSKRSVAVSILAAITPTG